MRHPRALLLLPALTFIVALAAASPAMDSRPLGAPAAMDRAPAAEAASSPTAVAGEVLVKFRAGTSPTGRQELLASLGLTEMEYVEDLRLTRARLPQGLALDAALAALHSSPRVEYAEPNYLFHTTIIPNDPLYNLQSWYLGLTEVPQGWDLEIGEPSVLVAVLDSGVDVEHPDLRERIWQNSREIPDNNTDDDENGCVDDVHGCNFVTPATADPACTTPYHASEGNVDDDQGHGTFVAGIIAGEANNQRGVAGIAPGVTLLPVKVLDCTGNGSAIEAAKGLLYAVQAGARVVNLSFGSSADSAAFRDAVRKAHDEFGAVLVAPAGNDGSAGVTFPGRLPEVIAVGASARHDPDARADFSNWGPEVDVAAPGENIVGPVPSAACGTFVACIQNQPYGSADGTSFAVAQVTGLAALILSNRPLLGPEQVRSAIRRGAQDLPDGNTPNWDGAGRIRAATSLSKLAFTIGIAGVTKS